MLRFSTAAACLVAFVLLTPAAQAQQNAPQDSIFVRQNYRKLDRLIPMRDGVKLYTVIYVPMDAGEEKPVPVFAGAHAIFGRALRRDNYPTTGPGTSRALSQEKYIFVYQDVRGRYKSEGQFEEVTPNVPGNKTKQTDESSDTYDTIEWLLKNVPNNNGRAGITGISYPGFYATAALPDAHPALKAVSPQAPVTDEFIGDDARHNGAFFLLDNFSFTNYFDSPRTGPVENYKPSSRLSPRMPTSFSSI